MAYKYVYAHVYAIVNETRTTHPDSPARAHAGVGTLSTNSSQLSSLRSLSYFFKLRAEHVHGPVSVKVAGERDVKPVAFFALNDKFREIAFARAALSRLRNHVDHQIPSARLSHFSQRARNCFFVFLCPAGVRANSDQSSDISAVYYGAHLGFVNDPLRRRCGFTGGDEA